MSAGLRSFLGSPWARILVPASLVYGGVAAWRRARLTSRSQRLSAPVISVGNITCGGTGKTPVVEMLARSLLARGWRPAILSRGYKAGPRGKNDEALVIEKALPGVPQFADPDRLRSGRKALEAGADVLILDDGFQHVLLQRDLDMVLVDALDPFGGGRVLPAGFLREPLRALHHAGLIAITRGSLVPPDLLGILRGILRDRYPGIPCIRIEAEPVAWEPLVFGAALSGGAGPDLAPGALRGRKVTAFAGIGNPEAFRRTLLSLGVEVAAWMPFPDHHRYTARDLARIRQKARLAGAQAIVTTAKDAVKIPMAMEASGIPSPGEAGPPWQILRIASRVVEGAEDLERGMGKALARGRRSNPGPGPHKESWP